MEQKSQEPILENPLGLPVLEEAKAFPEWARMTMKTKNWEVRGATAHRELLEMKTTHFLTATTLHCPSKPIDL